MGRHDSTVLTKARDELMSHIVRCDVLEAEKEHQHEWLDDTLDYMAGRYPMLSDLQFAHLETMGRQYIRPAIRHGADFNAMIGRTPDGQQESVAAA